MKNNSFNKTQLVINPSENAVTDDRDKFLGGSDIAKVTSKKTLYSMFKQKQKNMNFANEYTELGHVMEAETKKFIFDTLNLEIPSASYTQENMRANVDGLLNIGNEYQIVECKNNTNDTSFTNIDKYIKQTNYYMYLFNAESAILLETDRRKDENGQWITDITEDMIHKSIIKRDDYYINNEIAPIYEDFKKLLNNPNMTYNEFVNNDTNKIQAYNEYLNNIIDKCVKYTELNNDIAEIKKEIKTRLNEEPMENDKVKISYRTQNGRTTCNNVALYTDYKQDYIDFRIENKPEKIPQLSLSFKNTNYIKDLDKLSVEELLDKLEVKDKEFKTLSEIKEVISELKDAIIQDFPNGVELNGVEAIISFREKENKIDKFIEYMSDKGIIIDKDNYMVQGEPTVIQTIKFKDSTKEKATKTKTKTKTKNTEKGEEL